MEMYPVLEINRNITANRFYAFPIIGFLAKIIMLIPVYFWLILVLIALFFINVIINPFVVLFTGKYWQAAYNLTIGYMRLSAKVSAYLYGLTDKYPYFKLSIPDFKLDMACPEKPSRFFAVPLLGGFVRIFVIMPFSIFQGFITYASTIGWFGSFAKVLFQGQYPESTYQLGRDSIRLNFANMAFILGLSDEYPSFEIDLKNKKGIKFMLIFFGVWIYFMFSGVNAFTSAFYNSYQKSTPAKNYQYDQLNIYNNNQVQSTTNSTVTNQEFNQLMQQLQEEAVKQQQTAQ